MQHEAEILFSLMEGKRIVTMFDYYEKREHSLLVLEYLQVSIVMNMLFLTR